MGDNDYIFSMLDIVELVPENKKEACFRQLRKLQDQVQSPYVVIAPTTKPIEAWERLTVESLLNMLQYALEHDQARLEDHISFDLIGLTGMPTVEVLHNATSFGKDGEGGQPGISFRLIQANSR